jgi:hypothetical protein
MAAMVNASLSLLLLIHPICKKEIIPIRGKYQEQPGQRDRSALFMTLSQNDGDAITVLGFGSLLSVKSSRLTFPDLTDFSLARVPNYRRVFGHPTSIFFRRGIADLDSLQMSSLSVEYAEGNPGFVASVFKVPNNDMMEDGVPSLAFLEREEEFNIIEVPYISLDGTSGEQLHTRGIICAGSTDEAYITRWGEDRFEKHFKQYGIDKIWGWEKDSGLRPCAIYLRHCYLAAKSMGKECFDSFLDETFLVDRATTIREYLDENPSVLEQLPPPELASRYSG